MTYLVKRGNKYGAKSTIYKGEAYHSKKEAGYARTLDLLKNASDPSERVKSWERQVKISIDINGHHICNYYCDFLVTFSDDHQELHEVKGFRNEIFRLKLLLLEAVYLPEHPELEYVIIT